MSTNAEPERCKAHTLHRNETCPEHGSYQARVLRWNRFEHVEACPQCREEAQEREAARQREYSKQHDARHAEQLLKEACLPRRYHDKTLASFQTQGHPSLERALAVLKAYVRDLHQRMAQGCCLILIGPPGTGKTHLAAGLIHAATHHGYSAFFAPVLETLRRIKDSWSRPPEDRNYILKQLTRPDLLVLDDVGIQFGTDAERLILFEIIDHRYRKTKPTIVTGNLARNEPAHYIGEQSLDRLMENNGATLVLAGESQRRTNIGAPPQTTAGEMISPGPPR